MFLNVIGERGGKCRQIRHALVDDPLLQATVDIDSKGGNADNTRQGQCADDRDGAAAIRYKTSWTTPGIHSLFLGGRDFIWR
ncbi:hypothetical protein [Sphingomonas sp. Leaf5]|uniref:hypothetical protein n=1 Tax=Sphingomonas sp. Leaf5 TaxID=1735671 RepID=UPI001F27882F|nr:hypothetical protein [Sphingomonas sp. Leaf5]